MTALAPVAFAIALLLVALAVARGYFASMHLPSRWASLGWLLRGTARLVHRTISAAIAVLFWRRRRTVRPLPRYSTVRLPDSGRFGRR